MATNADVVTIARNYLRDFPKFFQLTFTPQGPTYDVGKPNLDESSLWVAFVPSYIAGASGAAASATIVDPTSYSVDARNGLIRFSTPPEASSVLIEGYYYEWLLPADLNFYAQMAVDLNTHNIGTPLAEMAPAVVDVVGIHALIQALWGLLSEYSRDIDVITSESVHVIASQRYRMVSSLLEFWTEEYNKRAQALNIGLDRMEVLTLRRVSRTTNHLVPIFRPREVGDYTPVERIYPEPDSGVVDITEKEDKLRQDVYVDGEPPSGYLVTGFY
jgi:hypothetical protein